MSTKIRLWRWWNNETGYYTESNTESDNDEYSDNDTQNIQKSWNTRDSGEPATFNFNIHSGEPVYSLDFLQGTEFFSDRLGGNDRSPRWRTGIVSFGWFGRSGWFNHFS